MPAMNEAEVYQYLTKDGDALGTIKKNTEMLRQHFTIESQRVAHALSQLDPHNQDRHAAEADRILHENNGTLDRVLMQIASTSPQKMSLPDEAINKASIATKVPKAQAKAVLSFPVILFAAIPAGLLYAVGVAFAIGLVVAVAAIVNALVFKMDVSGITASLKGLDYWFIGKIWYGIWYVVAVVSGFMSVRSGATLWETFNMLFFEPLSELLDLAGAATGSGGKKR